MKKINNHGFLLVEVIIVSTVIIGVMVSMYISFNRLYTAYDERSKYYDIDGLYACKIVEDYLIEDLKIDSMINNQDGIYRLVNNKICDTMNTFTNCSDVVSKYNINNLYFAKYNKDKIDNISANATETLKNYLTYLKSNEDFKDYSSIIIVELKKNDQGNDKDYSYASLKVK